MLEALQAEMLLSIPNYNCLQKCLTFEKTPKHLFLMGLLSELNAFCDIKGFILIVELDY